MRPVKQRQHRPLHQQGQALVELALVLFILLAIIIAGIDAIQVAMTHYTVGQAARAAAHEAAITGGNETEARQAAIAILDSGMTTNADRATIGLQCTPPPQQTGCPRYSAYTVTVIYHGQVWAPDPFGIFSSFTASASSTRTTENDQQGSSTAPVGPTTGPCTRPISSCVPRPTPSGINSVSPRGAHTVPGSNSVIPGAQP